MARPILIAGPTASGKSALALALAERLGGWVINADSQQVFDGWRVLTARPEAREEARAPHRLFGHVALGTPYSVGSWVREVAEVLAQARAAGAVPIIAGGTGLYFKALTEGMAPIPAVAPEIRAEGEAALERLGLRRFAAALADRDPDTAASLDLANPMRVLRAWEVLEASGVGLAAWRARTGPPLVPLLAAQAVALVPPRAALFARIDARLDAMPGQGLMAELAAVRALGLGPEAPGMKAVGAPEFLGHHDGESEWDTAMAGAKTATRRYAKRQITWIRNQMAEWPQVSAEDPTGALREAEAALGL